MQQALSAILCRPAAAPPRAGCAPRRSSAAAAAVAARAPPQQQQQRRRPGGAGGSRRGPPPAEAIRAVDSFDASFELTEEQSKTLNELLHSDLFCQQVVRDCKLPEGAAVSFTGVLFQPRPWTPKETKGMPAEVEEKYHGRPDEFTIINVPPVFMFQAKVFNPPRLCAVYKRL